MFDALARRPYKGRCRPASPPASRQGRGTHFDP
ncbi:hypothetical protein [Duganella sp. BJB1802]